MLNSYSLHETRFWLQMSDFFNFPFLDLSIFFNGIRICTRPLATF